MSFPDDNLKTAVEGTLLTSDPTPTDMLDLLSLRYSPTVTDFQSDPVDAVTNLTGLQYAVHLQTLDLRLNRINSIAALSGLTNLIHLDLSQNNNITLLTPLSGLTNLQHLDLHGNNITNISPLSSLTNLKTLIIKHNHISDVRPLSNLKNIGVLYLTHNLISDIQSLTVLRKLKILKLTNNLLSHQAYETILYTIKDNNPQIQLTYDPNPLPPAGVIVSDSESPDKIHIAWQALPNGPVYTTYYRVYRSLTKAQDRIPISDWQTTLQFEDTNAIPEITYTYWIQTATSDQGIKSGAFSQPEKGKLSTFTKHTFYVDDNAPNDPGPNDLSISDPNEDGTKDHPFDEIQEAIVAANDNDTIQVKEGRYYETINSMGKNIHLNGLDPNTTNITDLPVIDANGLGTVITFNQAEDMNCVISGFVLTRGYSDLAGAVACIGSSPVIEHCLIVGNRFTDPNGGAVYLQDSNSVFINVTVADNAGMNGGGGITTLNSTNGLSNCILWNNEPNEIKILSLGLLPINIEYSTVTGSRWSDDPLFVSPGLWVNEAEPHVPLDPTDPNAIWVDGDYHVMSEGGRWDPVTATWVTDDATSPAIDAGNPLNDWPVEPVPNGDRINQGVYGGTSQASKSNK